MPQCLKCDSQFPNRIVIAGRVRVISNRSYCLECSPWGIHNTVPLHERVSQNGQTKTCRRCARAYVYTRGDCSTTLFCRSCSSTRRHHLLKEKAIKYLGGKCVTCGYSKCVAALDFHHVDPATKLFQISGNLNRSWAVIEQELRKCALVCCRCHRELEAGLIKLPC